MRWGRGALPPIGSRATHERLSQLHPRQLHMHVEDLSFFPGIQFQDSTLERRYLLHVAQHGIRTDCTIFCIGTVIGVASSLSARFSECDELAANPCPFGFWVLPATRACLCAGASVMFIAATRWKSLHKNLVERYQTVIMSFFTVFCILTMAAGTAREALVRPEKRCAHNLEMCPNFNWIWLQVIARSFFINVVVCFSSLTYRNSLLFGALSMALLLAQTVPMHSVRGEDGGRHTVNAFEPGSVLMGWLYILMVTVLSIRSKRPQELMSRSMFHKSQRVLSQHASIARILRQYIPARFNKACDSGLVMEQFPVVTIMFCSFDKEAVKEYLRTHDAEHFLTLLSTLVIEFDILLENNNLYKLENVGSDYIVTSSVVTWGVSESHPDTHARRVKDAVDLVYMAQQMLIIAMGEEEDELGGGEELDIKVGLHTGPCVGAVAGEQRRFYRLFGDTINTAARMCSHSTLGYVQLSEVTHHLLQGTQVQAELRGRVKVKGKGDMNTYQVFEPVVLHSHTPRMSSVDILVEPKPQMHDMERPSLCDDLAGEMRLDVSLMDDCEMHLQATNTMMQEADAGPARTPRHSRAKEGYRIKLIQRVIGDRARSSATPEAVDLIVHESGPFRALTGEFLDVDMEVAYQTDTAKQIIRESKLLLSAILLSMIFIHGYVYQQNEYLYPKRSNAWVLAIGSIVVVMQGAMLWCICHDSMTLSRTRTLFWAAFTLSAACMVPLVLVVPMRFPLLGLVLLAFYLPSYTGSTKAVALMLVCIGLIIASPLATNGEYDVQEGGIVQIAVYLIAVLVLRHSLYVKARTVWQVERELETQRRSLGALLYDLIPNVLACRFVLKQHERLNHVDTHTLLHKDLVWVAPLGTSACVLSTDLVNFTPLSEKLGAVGVVHLLHDLWCIMDRILASARQKHKKGSIFDEDIASASNDLVQVSRAPSESVSRMFSANGSSEECSQLFQLISPVKIETVGDAYVMAIMLDRPSALVRQESVMKMLSLARAIAHKVVAYSNTGPHGIEPGSIEMRMGMCLGSAVSGLVGLMQPRYHVVGDALCTAAELESKSQAFHVNMDKPTCDVVKLLNGNQLVDLFKFND